MKRLLLTTLAVLSFSYPALADEAKTGIALHGDPKYPPSFQHLDYVNPDAPKGGEIYLMAIGTFSTLNPFTLLGAGADGAMGAGLQFDSLMASTADEPKSEYGLVAETITLAPDNSSVIFKLRKEAKFQDGTQITPEDVIFSFETLRDKGHPFYQNYFKDVTKAEKIGADQVKFTFRDTSNSELPFVIGQLPILSQKFWAGKDFGATNLDPILGSGPYKVSDVNPGSSITYTRVKDWWAKDLPINKGRYNFDIMHFDYYRDTTVALEAFLSGRFDEKYENVSKNWAVGYTGPSITQGLIKKDSIKNQVPQGMQAFVFNLRRPLFQDRRVREALNYAFDFEWANKTVAYGSYKRLNSYFENSELAGHGLPSPEELKLLEPFRGKIPDQVFTEEYKAPVTDGSGDDRENLRKAADLLKQAGWTLKNNKLTNAAGQPFTIEIVEDQPAFERWIMPWLANLKRLGIDANYRVVDTSQMQSLLNDFNFDVTIRSFPQSISPGNGERDYFEAARASVKGSSNWIGVKDPAVDALVENVIHAQSRQELITATRALDRVLMWGEYVVPNWYIDSFRVAYWDLFGRPAVNPPYDLAVDDTWWIDPAKVSAIRTAQHRQ